MDVYIHDVNGNFRSDKLICHVIRLITSDVDASPAMDVAYELYFHGSSIHSADVLSSLECINWKHMNRFVLYFNARRLHTILCSSCHGDNFQLSYFAPLP